MYIWHYWYEYESSTTPCVIICTRHTANKSMHGVEMNTPSVSESIFEEWYSVRFCLRRNEIWYSSHYESVLSEWTSCKGGARIPIYTVNHSQPTVKRTQRSWNVSYFPPNDMESLRSVFGMNLFLVVSESGEKVHPIQGMSIRHNERLNVDGSFRVTSAKWTHSPTAVSGCRTRVTVGKSSADKTLIEMFWDTLASTRRRGTIRLQGIWFEWIT